ncbi:uncharacterized protein BDZ99DRAFT_519892 [Mytilinidion resinicola]|uniref:Uncharacterized protein n=1 Tax=Mytilinidion resinicola TaxID=574789 RepID=A0A6A6YTK4_9PEZI|nr:uncharacterized protein BDZ99DRAFT_519892 [Mytilinidion resinicola]KAF2811237.1 hypothetical protein BDZ99DRAFT_519892 [Mytilinidion resinicola]
MPSFPTAFCGACGQDHYDISSEAELKLWKDLEAANASFDSRVASAIIAILRDCSTGKDCYLKTTIHHAIRVEGERIQLQQETFDLKAEKDGLRGEIQRLHNKLLDERAENRDLAGEIAMLVGQKEEMSLRIQALGAEKQELQKLVLDAAAKDTGAEKVDKETSDGISGPRKLVCQACYESSGTPIDMCDGRYPCTQCMAQGHTCLYRNCFKNHGGRGCKSSKCTMWHGEEGYGHDEL